MICDQVSYPVKDHYARLWFRRRVVSECDDSANDGARSESKSA